MPTAEQLAAIYSFPNLFERALQAVFADAQIAAYTSQLVPTTGNAAQDAALVADGYEIISFQRDRPRAEILFTPGAGLGRFIPLAVAGTKVPVESCWSGTYLVRALTKPDIREHNAFVVQLRFLLQTMGVRLNGTAPMTRHAVAPMFRDGGSSPLTKNEDGYYETTLQYNLNFSVQADAWASIAS